MVKIMFYAHIREDGTAQTVEDHLRGTAERCARFASRFGEADRGYMLGYAHDIGKCSAEFQKRLFACHDRWSLPARGAWIEIAS